MGPHIGFEPHPPVGVCGAATADGLGQRRRRVQPLEQLASLRHGRAGNHRMGREAHLRQPGLNRLIRLQHGLAVVGAPLEALLHHTQIPFLIEKQQQLLAHRKHRHGGMGAEARLTGQAQLQPTGLNPQARLGLAGGERIREAWNLTTEGAQLIGIDGVQRKIGAQAPAKRQG